MSLFYGALGLFLAIAHPALFWPVAIALLVVDFEEALAAKRRGKKTE